MRNGELANPLSAAAKQLKEISGKKSKTDADFERMAEIEFKAGLYMDEDSGPVIPAKVIEAAIYEAARATKSGKIAKSACFVKKNAVLQYDGPRDADGLWMDESMRCCVCVKVKQSRIVRTRPIFREWSAFIEVEFEDSVANESQVVKWLKTAGTSVGIGDWRPQNGRFTATAMKKQSASVVTAENAMA